MLLGPPRGGVWWYGCPRAALRCDRIARNSSEQTAHHPLALTDGSVDVRDPYVLPVEGKRSDESVYYHEERVEQMDLTDAGKGGRGVDADTEKAGPARIAYLDILKM